MFQCANHQRDQFYQPEQACQPVPGQPSFRINPNKPANLYPVNLASASTRKHPPSFPQFPDKHPAEHKGKIRYF